MAALSEESDEDYGYGLVDDPSYFDTVENPRKDPNDLWDELTQLQPEYEDLNDMLYQRYKGKIKNIQNEPKRPMIVGFHHFRKNYYELRSWIDMMYQVALKYKNNDLTLAVGDFEDGPLLGFKWLERVYNGRFYDYDYSTPWLYAVDEKERIYDCLGFGTVGNVSEYANKLCNGTIYTSEPIPPAEESAKTLVKKAVADNSDELVWQNEKDVFLILYASYDQLAGELLKTAAELANIIKDENIEIVQMNFEENYTHINLLQGYSPICYFIPRLNKNSNIMYDLGPRTIENLGEFLFMNATDKMKHFDPDGNPK